MDQPATAPTPADMAKKVGILAQAPIAWIALIYYGTFANGFLVTFDVSWLLAIGLASPVPFHDFGAHFLAAIILIVPVHLANLVFPRQKPGAWIGLAMYAADGTWAALHGMTGFVTGHVLVLYFVTKALLNRRKLVKTLQEGGHESLLSKPPASDTLKQVADLHFPCGRCGSPITAFPGQRGRTVFCPQCKAPNKTPLKAPVPSAAPAPPPS